MKITGARQAIHEAYALGYKRQGLDIKRMMTLDFRTTFSGHDNGWHHIDELIAGLVIHALSQLPAHQQDWAVWCYGPQLPEYLPEQRRFFTWLHQIIAIALLDSERQYRAATCDKIRSVVASAALEYRIYSIRGERRYSVSHLCLQLSIPRQNWTRDFQPWFDWAWRLFDTLDAAVLSKVSPVVKQVNR